MPEVSVVIPSRNEMEGIRRCLEEIAETFTDQHIDGEIIMSDNSITISPEAARTVERALYCYRRVVGLGNDLRAASVNREVFSDISRATREVSGGKYE